MEKREKIEQPEVRDQRDINAAKAFDQYGKPLYHKNRMAGLTYLTLAGEKCICGWESFIHYIKKNEAL